MSRACPISDAACALLIFLPIVALTSLDERVQRHARVVRVVRGDAALDRGDVTGEAMTAADLRDGGGEVCEQLGRALDDHRRARCGGGDDEQRVGDLDGARELVAGVGGRRCVGVSGLAGDRARVEQPLVAVEAERGVRGLLSRPARPDVAAAGLGDADSARSGHGRRGDRRGRRTCLGSSDRPDRALVGEPDVAVGPGPDAARQAARRSGRRCTA